MNNLKRSLIACCLLGIMLNTYPAQTNSDWYNPIARMISWLQNNVKKEYVIVSALTAGTLASIYLYHKHKNKPSAATRATNSSQSPKATTAAVAKKPSMASASAGHPQKQPAVNTTKALTAPKYKNKPSAPTPATSSPQSSKATTAAVAKKPSMASASAGHPQKQPAVNTTQALTAPKHKNKPSAPTPATSSPQNFNQTTSSSSQTTCSAKSTLLKASTSAPRYRQGSRYFVGHYFPAQAQNQIAQYFSDLSTAVVNIAIEKGFQEKSNSRAKTVGADQNFSQYHLTIAPIGEITSQQYHDLTNDLQKGFITTNKVDVIFDSIEIKASKDKDKTTNLPIYNIMFVSSSVSTDLLDLHDTATAKIKTIVPTLQQFAYKPHVLLAKIV